MTHNEDGCKWYVVRRWVRSASVAVALLGLLSLPCSTPFLPWRVYAFRDGAFTLLQHRGEAQHRSTMRSPSASPHSHCPTSRYPFSFPSTWHVTAAVLADVTHDQAPEWVLLVWRPWRDWPIQRWSSVPSPIAGFHDAAGDSCHLLLLDPGIPATGSQRRGREIWAGSALPAPLLALAVGDVDGDEENELVTLEGDYAIGRDGPASHVDVWGWTGFGFTLEWRSPPGIFHQLRLTAVDNGGILDIAVR